MISTEIINMCTEAKVAKLSSSHVYICHIFSDTEVHGGAKIWILPSSRKINILRMSVANE